MLRIAMEKVVIVGAGLTGSASSAFIRKSLPRNVSLKIIDKSRGSGGRMSTSRPVKVSSASVDLGAQYISVTPEYALKHKSTHEELLSSNILGPSQSTIEGDKSPATTKHFVAPNGSGSIVKHFLKLSGSEFVFNEVLSAVDVENEKVKLTCQSGSSEICDGVILTMPVPQILQLNGSIKELIDADKELKNNLENVSYSCRFAIGLFYNPGTILPFSWGAKYVTDNSCVRFIAIDDKKRGVPGEASLGHSVVVHTSVPFSIEHLERDKEEMKSVILTHTMEVLPELPQPQEVKGHKWRYSQVHKPFSGAPGCVVISEKPLIVLAGDAFTHSNLDGCISSAMAVHETVLKVAGKL